MIQYDLAAPFLSIFLKEKNTNLKTYMYKINKVLLYSIGNYMQYSEINHNGKEHEKEYN